MMTFTALVVAATTVVTPKVGDIAPDFKTRDIEGNEVSLSKLTEQGPVLLAFFPKAFTPGCTKQLSAYAEQYTYLKERNTHVIAVSMDDADTLKRFKESLKADFVFVPDPAGRVVKMFDLQDKQAAKRAAFVIGKDRRVLRADIGEHALETLDKTIKSCEMSG